MKWPGHAFGWPSVEPKLSFHRSPWSVTRSGLPYDVSRLTTGCEALTGLAATTAAREAREKSDATVKYIVRRLEVESDEAGVGAK